MSLSALAIVGRHRTPFYMRDFASDAENLSSFGIYGQGGLSDAEFFGDHFGVVDDEAVEKTSSAWPCNLHHQFLLQAACDQLEEALREGRWRPNGSGADACWVGSVMTSDNYKAFGERVLIIFIEIVDTCFRYLKCQSEWLRTNANWCLF